MNFKFAFLFINALVAIQLCAGQNSTTGTERQTNDGTSTEKTALQKGMDPIFDLYQNFLDTVMPYNFYDDKDSPFSLQDVIHIANTSDFSKLQSDWKDIANTFKGYAGCIIMGYLFIFFMPIIGMIYCCCHCCCHKCGGTRETMDPKRASCKRWTYTIILLICTTLMLAGGIITFLGSDLLHKSLRNEDNNGIVGKMVQSLGHVQKFTNDSLNELKDTLEKKLITDGLNTILPEISDAASKTVEMVKDSINATELLEEASDLGEDAKGALEDLQNLKIQVTNLQKLQNDIGDKLQAVQNTVKACGTNCSDFKNVIDSLSFHPNFTSLQTLEQKAAVVAKAVNISDFVEKAKREFDSVTSEVNKTVSTEIQEAGVQIESLNSTINDETKQLSGRADPFVKEVKEGEDFLESNNDTIKEIADYIWYSCIGMGCAVILVVFFYYMGVLYGLCGERPGSHAACCNRGTGACLLSTGICCSFLFAWLLMLVVLLLFSLGGLSYSMACKYISGGVEKVKVFEDVLSDGFGWNVSKSFGVKNLTVSGMFQDCKDNKSLYSALHLQYVFDVDKQFNLTSVISEVEKMEHRETFNIPPIKLMSKDLENQLLEFKNASLFGINFTEYTVELKKTPFKDRELDNAISKLNTAATNLNPTAPSIARNLSKAAQDLEVLKDNEIHWVKGNMTALSKVVDSLQVKANLSTSEKIDRLIASIKETEENFNNKSNNFTSEGLKEVVPVILFNITEKVNSSLDYIKNDFGRCRPLYDAAQSTVDAVCVVTLDPFNSIWFGLGWSLFFYIPCIIFAALLASLYKRSERYRKKASSFDDPRHAQYTGDSSGHRGSRGSRYEDNVPLTSMGKDQRYSANGAYNPGYQGREYEQEPRFHRDEHHGYPPDNYSRDRGVPRGSGGPHYAQPHADPYDQPPRYDDAVSDHYDRGYRHGGYPSLSSY